MRRWRSLLSTAFVVGVGIGTLSACRRAPSPTRVDAPDSSTPGRTATTATSSTAPIAPTLAPARSGARASPTASAPLPAAVGTDAGAGKCVVLRGPIELPIRVPAALALRGEHIEAVVNDDGRPRIVSRPLGPVPLGAVPSGREAAEGERTDGFGVPCAIAGDRIFCTDRSGAVHRWTGAGDEDHVVASARSTSRIAAGPIGGQHVALAYLASRQTSEGWASEAWLAVDDGPPQRVSEDGSGATALALAPRGDALLLLMTDARTALTAMHARMVSYDGRVRLGEDAVIFVGGPGDRRTRAALAVQASGPAWSLLPIAKDVGSFGLALVRIDDPPRVDEPVTWSMYANGIDPAPVAAAAVSATPAADAVVWVAVVRPRGAEPLSARVLEVASIGPQGSLQARDVVPTTGDVTDVTLAADPFGALWLAWVDSEGAWLERLACGLKALRR